VTTHGLEVPATPAEHFDNDFGRAAHRALDELDLLLWQVIPATGSPTGIGGYVEEGFLVPDPNE
jgi:hypothetical protein